MPPLRRGCLLIVPAVLVIVALSGWVFPAESHSVISRLTSSGPSIDPDAHHVFLTTQPRWHEEVWLCLGGMLKEIGVKTTTFTECDDPPSCIRYGLMAIAEKMGIGTPIKKKDDVFGAVGALLPSKRYADTIVLATEKEDFEWASERLLALWNQRPADEKFRLVAVYHEPTGNLEQYARDWAATGSLSFLTLSPHVATHLKHRLNLLAADSDPWSRVEHIKVRTVIPWLPAAEAGLGTPRKDEVARKEHEMPCRVVINGMISSERRAYRQIFEDLLAQIKEDPRLWGYVWNGEQNVFQALHEDDPDRFKLLILGERSGTEADLPDPGQLANVVEFHSGYAQEELYDFMASTDLLLLGWNGGYRYLDSQASSSAFTTLETEVPLLITPQIAEAYNFLGNTDIVKPHALSEIDAVALFRRYPRAAGRPLAELEKITESLYPSPQHHKSVAKQAAIMLRAGWKRDANDWKKTKAALKKENVRVWKELLSEQLE